MLVYFEPGPIGADINMIKWNGDKTKLPFWKGNKTIGWSGGDSVELLLARSLNLCDEILKKADTLLRDEDGDYNASVLLPSWLDDDDTPFEEKSTLWKKLIETYKKEGN